MKFLSAVLFSLTLAACGGGGGSSNSITPVPIANSAPIASAGANQSVGIGELVTLDGSASSDANNDPLTYAWTLTVKPAASAATLSSLTLVKPTFTADLAGTYVASLTVNDGEVSSTAATVSITAGDPLILPPLVLPTPPLVPHPPRVIAPTEPARVSVAYVIYNTQNIVTAYNITLASCALTFIANYQTVLKPAMIKVDLSYSVIFVQDALEYTVGFGIKRDGSLNYETPTAAGFTRPIIPTIPDYAPYNPNDPEGTPMLYQSLPMVRIGKCTFTINPEKDELAILAITL
jgi:hypothetical protein